MLNVFLLLVMICIFLSLKSFFTPLIIDKHLTIKNFIWLAVFYSTIALGFGMIYLLLELESYTVILELGRPIEGSYLYKLATAMYFSSVTFFSVGYGDLSPVGIGRAIAAVQAFLGYVLPAAFVIKTVITFENHER
ncbi:ion channel [Peribacillus kribbensis]|uniref:ion channel n=1 Tax=Peribacillus kribbensis TaxID=356658 RepID=UPI0003F9F4F4|nr:ion channel [Peribacillus kribbensis]